MGARTLQDDVVPTASPLRGTPTASSRLSAPPPRLPRRVPVVFVKTALGGACSLLAIITLVALAALLILRYVRFNTLEASSLAVLSAETNAAAVGLPFAKAPRKSLLAGASGVQLRVYAQGGLGACSSPTSFANDAHGPGGARSRGTRVMDVTTSSPARTWARGTSS